MDRDRAVLGRANARPRQAEARPHQPRHWLARLPREPNFGVLELFEGKQHRQHAAMVVMSMLGFYFEPARHDRDKHIRVHVRHIRPDKLHHFEKMRAEATLPLPYDYDSATHPAWQFWRQIGRTGISTVATYKDKDPDGTIMKSLGQHSKLLSDIDIIKINSVYAHQVTLKYQVAIALAVIKSKPNNITIEQYINRIRNKIDKMDFDSDITICSDDFKFDDETVCKMRE
ncbi:Low choriolytic enzyme [Papilio machaon]|uniref:Metalloendopeptidase n=1 Tax=Papilio machaon TaxID=76193 RepID=A0A0N1IBP2_PAPMA|nr:Low choriolytic enzyme [Papilio machaon]